MAGTATAEKTESAADQTSASTTNASTEQKTTVGGRRVKAEGQKIREGAPEARTVDLGTATIVDGIGYDEDTGRLIHTESGKPISNTADATDLDVGWTVQGARHKRDEDGNVTEEGTAYPGLNAHDDVPSQTFHPDELPDPLVAVRNGLLPQNVTGLRLDEDKFKKKHDFEA